MRRLLGPCVAMLVVWSCADHTPSTFAPDDRMFEHGSVDAVSSSAVPGFFFLPPLAPSRPVFSGTFDGSREPEIRICRWDGVACDPVLAAHYTRATGTGGTTIQVLQTQQSYHVDWPLAEVVPGQVYRIRVLLHDIEVGHVDAKAPSPAEPASQVRAQGYVPLGNAGSLPIRFRIETSLGAATATIGNTGGQIAVPDLAQFEFPAHFFSSDISVEVRRVQDVDALDRFTEFEGLFRVSSKTGYQVRLLAGGEPPQGAAFQAVFSLPQEFMIQSGSRPELFAQVYEDAGMEVLDNFQILPSAYDPLNHTLTATLPAYVFTDQRRDDGLNEALFMIGTTPGGGTGAGDPSSLVARSNRWRVPGLMLLAADNCEAGFIGRPVPDHIPVTSHYGERTHPVTGAPHKMHWGTDFGAATGTGVIAAADGTVEVIRTQIDKKTGEITGYGLYIILRHTDGSSTLYAHLKEANVTVNQAVERGASIALSDNTGTSTGPHLHFEYVPNGQIVQSKHRVDPFRCMQDRTAQGSLTVRDNGTLADDAFAVYLDGVHIGSTEIGASNTLALNNLRIGTHTLLIVAIVAPDNVGTYEVILSHGITFLGGGTRQSGSLPTGGTVSFTIVVPDTRVQTLAPELLMRPNSTPEGVPPR